MTSDNLYSPFIIRHESGVRIRLSDKLWFATAQESKPHLLDNDPKLKAMQNSLRVLFIRSERGSKRAQERLFAIHQLLYPEAHSLPASVERALELRHLMCQLSYLATPKTPDSSSILTGPIKLREDPSILNQKLYKVAKACYKKNATLKSLAIRIFLMKLEKEGFGTIDEKLLKRDLAELEIWDKKKTGGASPDALQIIFSSDECLPYQFHAQKWRTRKGLPQFIKKVQG